MPMTDIQATSFSTVTASTARSCGGLTLDVISVPGLTTPNSLSMTSTSMDVLSLYARRLRARSMPHDVMLRRLQMMMEYG